MEILTGDPDPNQQLNDNYDVLPDSYKEILDLIKYRWNEYIFI
jgi:hypothetical protein